MKLLRTVIVSLTIFLGGLMPVLAGEAPFIPNPPLTLPALGEEIVYGVYDPEGTLLNQINADVAVEHVYLAWNVGSDEMTRTVNAVLNKGNIILLSLEPRSWDGYQGLGDDTLFDDVINGWYDNDIRETCNALKSFAPQRLLVRFAHESNSTAQKQGADLFPWQLPAEQAIKMYRYFVIACRDVLGADNLEFVWSPVPSANIPDYYPGDDVVDFIGLTLLGYRDYDLTKREYPTSFNEQFWPAYDLVNDYNKPIIIAELGVCCGFEYQKQWLTDAAYAYQSRQWYPQLWMVVYFQHYDPYLEWLPGLAPDWRICPDLFPPSNLFDGTPQDCIGT